MSVSLSAVACCSVALGTKCIVERTTTEQGETVDIGPSGSQLYLAVRTRRNCVEVTDKREDPTDTENILHQ